MKKKIVVTRRWPEQVEQLLAQKYDCEFNTSDISFDQQKLRDALRNADALLTTVTDNLDASVMSVDNPRARIIANFGVGFSHIDTQAAVAKNIVVTNTPDVLSDCTADLAMTLLLMSARRAGEGERELRSGNWTGWRPTHLMGTKVSGKTLGIVGFGRIGRAMAKRAYAGFDMNIKVFNRSQVPAASLVDVGAEPLSSIEELLTVCDFVSLHCPGGGANTHLINAERLELMKPDAHLINTARGEVVDEEALVASLSARRIAGAGLDVFENEPAINTRLPQLSNAVLLPHLGSATVETRDAMGFRVLSNLEQFFAGIDPSDRVV